MTWRALREADLAAVRELEPRNHGDELVGPEAARGAWADLFGNPAFRGIVVECDSPANGRQIVAAGAGVFVTADFATSEIANPRPGLNARIIASLVQDRSVLLPHDCVGQANAGSGIDVVNLVGSWRRQQWAESAFAEMQALLAASFLEVHRGFRLNRLLREVVRQDEVHSVESSGIFRIVARFPEWRALTLLTREDTRQVPYSIAHLIFQYQEPVLRLSESDQQLLRVALGGQMTANSARHSI